MKKKLGVNIDHVATIRNARGEDYPDPLKAALFAEKNGADSITIHLREDRRHIVDKDLKNIKRKLTIPLNLEIAPTKEMLNIALKYKPESVCIVPEKRKEITTEGGLNLKKQKKTLKNIIAKMKKKKIRVSLFIEPKISDIILSKELNADCVELHTGKFCNLFNKKKKFKI
jgi:pyridoxine 5-phosphate synthase